MRTSSRRGRGAGALQRPRAFGASLALALVVAASATAQELAAEFESAWSAELDDLDRMAPDERALAIGHVTDFDGPFRDLAGHFWRGLELAMDGETVGDRPVNLTAASDGYDPRRTGDLVRAMIDAGIVAMVGNLGTPTAAVSLPMLRRAGVPAIAFNSGGAVLRDDWPHVVNLRGSYSDEVRALAASALDNGLDPGELCAVLRTDSVGQSSLEGLSAVVAERAAGGAADATLQRARAAFPVALDSAPIALRDYRELRVPRTYRALERYEARSGLRCRLVVVDAGYEFVVRFAQFSRLLGKRWIIGALSFSGGADVVRALQHRNITKRFVSVSITPEMDSDIPVLALARERLGREMTTASLHGFLAGRLALGLLRAADDPTDGESILAAKSKSLTEFRNLDIDLTSGGGGLYVTRVLELTQRGWLPVRAATWRSRN